MGTEVRTQLSLLPTHEHVSAACRHAQLAMTQDLEDLRSRYSRFPGLSPERANIEEKLAEALARLAECATKDHVLEVCRSATGAQAHEIEQIHAKLQEQIDGGNERVQDRFTLAINNIDAHAVAIDILRQRLDMLVQQRGVSGIDRPTGEELDRISADSKRIDETQSTLEQLRQRVDLFEARASPRKHVAELLESEFVVPGEGRVHAGSRLRDHGNAIAELREQLSVHTASVSSWSLPDGKTATHTDIEDLRINCNRAIAQIREELEDVTRKELEDLRVQVETVRQGQEARVRLLEHTAGDASELRQQLEVARLDDQALRRRVDGQADELAALQSRLAVATNAAADATAAAVAAASACASSSQIVVSGAPGGDLAGHAEEPLPIAFAHQEDLGVDVQELRSQCNMLQEVVDKQLLVAVWELDRKLPEAMVKVDRVLKEHVTRMGKTEEHEVRLNLVLTKLSLNEEKLQNCMDRLERHPGVNQFRSMWREDLHRQLQDVDVEGLRRRVQQQMQAVDEMAERVQGICEYLSYGDGLQFHEKAELRQADSDAHRTAGHP